MIARDHPTIMNHPFYTLSVTKAKVQLAVALAVLLAVLTLYACTPRRTEEPRKAHDANKAAQDHADAVEYMGAIP